MTDVFPPQKRSQIMSSIRGYDTQPELSVRSLVHRMGYRFRIRQGQLPGDPDIVLPRHRKVIFIHGCFWHSHKKCKRSKRPSTNETFWNQKLDKNIDRDKRQQGELRKLGWKTLVVWQCQIRIPAKLEEKIKRFMNE
ncbi:MAG: DNA mismatch endonuclease Vsr [Acidobacteria bacterium]|nr:DNA mismatch endonuclease Vsr [Acidobacteriota bacterium]